MNYNQLKSFIFAAEFKSFTKAAESSFISVPALKKQIDTLEREIGVKLFHRSNKGIILTLPGEYFLKKCMHMVQYLHDTINETNAIATKEENFIRIGYRYSCVADPVYFDALTSFKNQYPETEVELINIGDQPHNFFDLRINDYFDAIDAMQPHILCEMSVFCIMRNSHALSKNPLITLEDLKPYEIEIPNPIILKQILPKLISDLQERDNKFLEVGVNVPNYSNLLSSNRVSIALGFSESLSNNVTQILFKGYVFNYMIYSHKKNKPIVDTYIDFLKGYYDNNYNSKKIDKNNSNV